MQLHREKYFDFNVLDFQSARAHLTRAHKGMWCAEPAGGIDRSLRPMLRVVEGQLTAGETRLLQAWVAINFDVIVQFWDGVIEYTEDALATLLPSPGEA